MTQDLQTSPSSLASDASGASFGCSADGMLVALVDEHAYAMASGRNGQHFLASGWRIARPMAEWIRSDFYGHGGDLADEAAFRAKVLEQAHHFADKRALGRVRAGFVTSSVGSKAACAGDDQLHRGFG